MNSLAVIKDPCLEEEWLGEAWRGPPSHVPPSGRVGPRYGCILKRLTISSVWGGVGIDVPRADNRPFAWDSADARTGRVTSKALDMACIFDIVPAARLFAAAMVRSPLRFSRGTEPNNELRHDDDELNFVIHQLKSDVGMAKPFKPLTVKAIIDHITTRQRAAAALSDAERGFLA